MPGPIHHHHWRMRRLWRTPPSCLRQDSEKVVNESLQRESEKLARSWMQHDSAWLRDYLVAGVEDPRLNLQSILTRHCLIRSLTTERFAGLMAQEYRFAAVLNWLTAFIGQVRDAE